MTDRQQKNVCKYLAYAGLSVAVATLGALLVQLSADGPINWRPVQYAGGSALLGVLTMMLGSMTLTRYGSEEIAYKVDRLREEGVHRKDMVVLPKATAVSLAAEVPPIHPDLTPGQTDQLLTLIHLVGPVRAISALNDEQYRDPSREGAP